MIINNTAMAEPALQAGSYRQTMESSGMEGGFAQLLLALFGGGEELPTGNVNIEGLLEQTGNGEKLTQDGEQENTDAMQMMAAFLAANGIVWQNPTEPTNPDLSQTTGTGTVQTVDTANLMDAMTLLNTASSGQTDTLLQAAVQLLSGGEQSVLTQEALPEESFRALQENLSKAADTGTPDGTLALTPEGSQMTVEKVSPSGDKSSLFDGQMSFRQSVAEAKKALDEERQKTPAAETVDVDALQQKVNSGREGTVSALRENSNTFQTRHSVVSQVKDNILQNLSNGKDEFIVKLKPESLGEITIKMSQENGKISMSIITASTQTAKLLNESVEALKNSLRPLQAEIREIVPRAEQPAESQQGNLFGSGFENFQHQQFYNREQPQYYYHDDASADADGDMDVDAVAEAEKEVPAAGRLRAYI